MNVGEAHAVDKALGALDRLDSRPSAMTHLEQEAVEQLRERAGRALQVLPAAIGRARA